MPLGVPVTLKLGAAAAKPVVQINDRAWLCPNCGKGVLRGNMSCHLCGSK